MCITFVKCIQGFQDPPPEGGQGVLDAGAQTQDALQLGLPQQLLPVGHEVRRAAQQSRHVVHELRHQTGVGVIRLAVVVGHHLGATERTFSARSLTEDYSLPFPFSYFVFLENVSFRAASDLGSS